MKEYRRYKQATDVFFIIIFKMQILFFWYHYIDASLEKKHVYVWYFLHQDPCIHKLKPILMLREF